MAARKVGEGTSKTGSWEEVKYPDPSFLRSPYVREAPFKVCGFETSSGCRETLEGRGGRWT